MKIFYCYSTNLKKFLVENGHNYLRVAIHPKTDKAYWEFEGTVELNGLLEVWKVRRLYVK